MEGFVISLQSKGNALNPFEYSVSFIQRITQSLKNSKIHFIFQSFESELSHETLLNMN